MKTSSRWLFIVRLIVCCDIIKSIQQRTKNKTKQNTKEKKAHSTMHTRHGVLLRWHCHQPCMRTRVSVCVVSRSIIASVITKWKSNRTLHCCKKLLYKIWAWSHTHTHVDAHICEFERRKREQNVHGIRELLCPSWPFACACNWTFTIRQPTKNITKIKKK